MISLHISFVMTAAWDIYAQQLMPLGHGHPLWGPEPCPVFGEVNLGDVGYLREGHFIFLFNTMCSADDPVNLKKGVPDGFEMLVVPDFATVSRPGAVTQLQLHSKSLQSTSGSVSASIRCECTNAPMSRHFR